MITVICLLLLRLLVDVGNVVFIITLNVMKFVMQAAVVVKYVLGIQKKHVHNLLHITVFQKLLVQPLIRNI